MSGNGGVGGPDLEAPAEALAKIASGIDLAHAELKDLGMIGRASVGRGFAGLALSGMELGDSALTSEFETFCNRWEWGVRALTLRGNAFAQEVGLSAGSFAEQEQYIKDSFKIGVNSLNGNPHLSEDDVKKMSWDKISSQHAYDDPDFSAESFSQANEEVKQTWKDTGYDVMDAQMDSMERSGLLGPSVRQKADEQLRETLDPSEQAVAQAEQPRWGER
ncbi:hypothetical protein ACIQWR_19690 [Streptomyces sp. NPDC098789]|uniref:hypothetical protein n=1 Tax=Streptomyces sp. NPDC098789 TaxID=3366098 RepID=UPI003826D9D9